MKKITLLLIATFTFIVNDAFSQGDDANKKSAIVFKLSFLL